MTLASSRFSKNLPLPLLIFSLSSLLCWSQPTNGYVVSWNNDTLQVKILYIDILHLQQELQVESPKGGIESLFPKDIKAFGLYKNTNLKLIDFSNYPMAETYKDEPQRGLLAAEFSSLTRTSKLGLFDSLNAQRTCINFTSITIDNDFSFFARDAFGARDGIQAYYYFYLKMPNYGRQTSVPIKWLNGDFITFKDGRYIPYPVGAQAKKYRKWLGNLVSDYTLLSTLVRRKEFPMYYNFIVDSYHEWKIQKSATPLAASDTLVAMRGVFDAKQYYKPKAFFWPTFAGSTLMLFPGAIYGVSKVTKTLKHLDSIPVPDINHTYAQDEKYKLGYRAMVTTKNQRAVDRGVMLGTLLCAAILVPLSL
jgi:hypothetical protein